MAGRRLFSERAVDAVTVDDIVRAADVGKGSFYNHFEDRDALVRAISRDIRANLEGSVARANADEGDPARRIARAVCIYLRFALDEPEPAGALLRIHSGHTSLSSPLNQGVVEDISQGLAEGRFRLVTVEAGVLCVLGITQLALARLMSDASESLAAGLPQEMCALLLRALGLGVQDADLIAAHASDEIIRGRGFTGQDETQAVH
jgi:AcrR family transcriptional regulator